MHINKAIQFTVESENENGELPFLDCLIERNQDGTLDTTVYRKPTNTGRYLDFHSWHSSATKQGFIKGLLLRAERLCSTPDLLKTEIERIYSELLSYSYPKMFIDGVKTRITNQVPLERNWTSTICISYVQRIAEAIRRTLNPEGIQVAFASTNTLGKSLTHVKGSIPKDKAGQLVYKLLCPYCKTWIDL